MAHSFSTTQTKRQVDVRLRLRVLLQLSALPETWEPSGQQGDGYLHGPAFPAPLTSHLYPDTSVERQLPAPYALEAGKCDTSITSAVALYLAQS
jgi:hypothetical protein